MKSQSETKEFKELMNKSIVAGEPAKQKKMPFGPSKEIRDDQSSSMIGQFLAQ